ncbi:MAG: hypothetical protein WDN06_06780 [Asticcacaulis sp.]
MVKIMKPPVSIPAAVYGADCLDNPGMMPDVNVNLYWQRYSFELQGAQEEIRH